MLEQKKSNKKPGRPIDSRNIRVVPKFREEPDIEKLGRALISLATVLAEKEKADQGISLNTDPDHAVTEQQERNEGAVT